MTDIPVLIERLRNGEFSAAPGPRLKLRIPSDLELEAADALSRLSEDKKRLAEALNDLLEVYISSLRRDLEAQDIPLSDIEFYQPVIAARSALKGEGT
jgi:hypothetical protein